MSRKEHCYTIFQLTVCASFFMVNVAAFLLPILLEPDPIRGLKVLLFACWFLILVSLLVPFTSRR